MAVAVMPFPHVLRLFTTPIALMLEACLAYAHFLAVLTQVVFLSSLAALCRIEWLNEAGVRRLGRLDLIHGVSAGAVLATGLVRVYLGSKGSAWYWGNPLLHVKLTLFVVMMLLSLGPTRAFLRWRRALDAGPCLPAAEEVRRVRRTVLRQAHLMPLIPLAAVFMARGFGR